jgi:hypothetical protein
MSNRVRASLLLFAALLPFSPSLSNALIWDDDKLLRVRLSYPECDGIADVWTQPYWGPTLPPDTYRPLSLSLLYAQEQAFGDHAAAGYRMVSLLLHAAVTLLVAAVVSRIGGDRTGFATALLFALHPVHAEAVAMAYGQLELLAALFGLLAAWLYLKALNGRGRLYYFAAFGCVALAACAKESALMLPALLALLRVTAPENEQPALRELWREALFLFAAVPYLLLRYHALGALLPDPEATVTLGYTLGMRIKAVIIAAGQAIRLCTFPTGQTVYYGHLRDSLLGWPVSELAWIVLGLAALLLLMPRIGRRTALFSMGWFALTLLPVSNIVPTGVLVAERTLYLPSLAVCFLAATVLARVPLRWLAVPATAAALASVLVVSQWRDAETLWRSTIAAHPRSPGAHLFLATAMIERWKTTAGMPPPAEIDSATESLRRALQLNPDLPGAREALHEVDRIRGAR